MTDETQTDQAVEQSVMERFTSKMERLTGLGGQAEPESVEQPTGGLPQTPEVAEIEWDGEKFQVPGKLKDAFMKNQDYTQKTQQLADRTRQVDHAREIAEQAQAERAFAQSVASEQQELSVIEAYLQQTTKMDWSQMPMDAMVRAKHEIDMVKERRDALRQAIGEKRQQFDTQLKTKIQELRTKAREMASKSITGFSEETEKAVRSFAAGEGLSDREIDNVLLDPRSFKILWKASQFDKIQAGTGKAVAAVEKVVKPGAASERMPAQTAAKLNFNKALKGATTSAQKAQVIESRLEGMFAKGKS